MKSLILPLILALATACTAASGGGSDAIELLPIADQSIAVDQTLVIPLVVNNPDGETLEYVYQAPTVAGIDRVATIAGTPAGGEFRWTPLASHVGRHELTFIVDFVGGESSQAVVVDVTSAGDAAPVFVMAAGGAFDLERDPCVIFPVEVRDDDTEVVRIELDDPPEGADVDILGPKSAQVIWCPTPDQTDTSLRWTLNLVAEDGDHDPVRQDYLVVLQTPAKEGCAGDEPTITVRQPANGDRVASAGGYPIVVDVTDDGQLRESPLLYWTTDPVDFPDNPDLTTFQQLEFVEDGGQWRARIPSFGLGAGEERAVRFVVVAYDNDDVEGTACDHRAQTSAREFIAVEGQDSGVLDVCEPCTVGDECATGLCVNSGEGTQCAEGCAGCAGTCIPGISASGTTTEICYSCGDDPGGDCVDDAAEQNDTLSAASSLPGVAAATICPDDNDFWEISAPNDQDVTVTLTFENDEGDLDLRVRDASGAILGSSASVEDVETVTTCVQAGDSVFAEVIGFGGSSAEYEIAADRVDTDCECERDDYEPNDNAESARNAPSGSFEGTICPGDEDFFSIEGPGEVDLLVSFDGGVLDLDLELLGPDGSLVGASRTTTDDEEITRTIGPGAHTIRIFPFDDGAIDYTANFSIGSASGCGSTVECPAGTICNDGDCEEVSCSRASDCPSGHICPLVGPGNPARTCADSCFDSFDCRADEACKAFPDGNACGLTGRGAVGDTCADYTDCGGRRACLDREAGYCAEAGCTSDSDCDAGSFCIAEGGDTYCAKDCGLGAFLCRVGHECDLMDSEGGELVFVCLP